MHWHPQGEVLVSASYDDTIKLWVEEDDEWICAQTLAGKAAGTRAAWGGRPVAGVRRGAGRQRSCRLWRRATMPHRTALAPAGSSTGWLCHCTFDAALLKGWSPADIGISCRARNLSSQLHQVAAPAPGCSGVAPVNSCPSLPLSTLQAPQATHPPSGRWPSMPPGNAWSRAATTAPSECGRAARNKVGRLKGGAAPGNAAPAFAAAHAAQAPSRCLRRSHLCCANPLPNLVAGAGELQWGLLSTLSGYHDRTIFSVHWSKAGLIASGAADNAIRIFGEGVAAARPASAAGEAGGAAAAAAAADEEAAAAAADAAAAEPALRDLFLQQGGDSSGGVGGSFALLCKQGQAHPLDVNCVRWHPADPTLLASAGDDACIKLWRWQPARTEAAAAGARAF